jgi:glutathione S-transferase
VLTLYAHANRLNVNALKVRVTLAEAGADYHYVAIDLASGEQRSPAFLALNPHGKVPVLVDGDFVLPESDAILWYIAESFPAANLLGPSIRDRARTLEWCAFTSTALYAAYYDLYFHTVGPAPAKRIPAVAGVARERLSRSLAVLEQALATRDHLAGPYSIADIAAASVLRSIKERLPAAYDASSHAAIDRWYDRVTARPAWQAALAV